MSRAPSVKARAVQLLDGISTTVERARSYVTESEGWRRRALALFAGAISVLAMAPFFLWPVLFFTLPVFLWLIDSAPTGGGRTAGTRAAILRAAAADGWWFGFGYFFFGLYWIGEAFLVEADIFGWLMPLAILVMPAGLALFYALIGACSRAVWTQGFSRVLILACSFGIIEWIRGHVFTGFPWNVLGYAFTYPLSLMQSASIVGVYGLTAWVVLVCATPIVLLADARTEPSERGRALLAGLVVAGLPLAVMFAFGLTQLSGGATTFSDGVVLRLVQPSVPQRDKWLNEKQSGIFADHLALSALDERGLVDDMAGVTHVIWPEASMPFLPLRNPVALKKIGELLPPGSVLIAGALRVEDTDNRSAEIPYDEPHSDTRTEPKSGQGGSRGKEKRATPGTAQRVRVFNSLMAFDGSGTLRVLHDKTHLVPFGEYLPFREALESIGLRSLTRLRGGFETGPVPRRVVEIPGLGPVGVLICYEAIFGGRVVQGKTRPKLLINITNDGWFGSTIGPYQHFHKSRVRAVEEGLPLIRSANNGISAVIDPKGRILNLLDLNVRGTLDSRLPKALSPTVYTIWNDLIFVLNVVLFAVIAGFMQHLRGKNRGIDSNDP